MTGDWLRLVAGPLIGALIGGLIVHFGARRRDRENERRRQRVDYLIDAYRVLARSSHRHFTKERSEAFEDALSEIVLLGNIEQIDLAKNVIETLAEQGGTQMDALLISLRKALRRELKLDSDSLKQVPSIRITPSEGEPQSPVTLRGATEVNYSQVARDTRRSVVTATAIADGYVTRANSRHSDTKKFEALHKQAEEDPRAAITAGYDSVLSELVGILGLTGDPEDGPRSLGEIARLAAEQGHVSDQFVQTAEGLVVLRNLIDGSSDPVPVERAHEYIDLVQAALHVVSHSFRSSGSD